MTLVDTLCPCSRLVHGHQRCESALTYSRTSDRVLPGDNNVGASIKGGFLILVQIMLHSNRGDLGRSPKSCDDPVVGSRHEKDR